MTKTYKSEERIQQECYMWFHNTYPEYRGCLFHVPNGGARSSVEGAMFKKIGVVPGVADMLLMVNSTTYCFELKNKYGKQSPKQVKWQKQIEKNGFNYFIIRDVNLFKQIVEGIMKKS